MYGTATPSNNGKSIAVLLVSSLSNQRNPPVILKTSVMCQVSSPYRARSVKVSRRSYQKSISDKS